MQVCFAIHEQGGTRGRFCEEPLAWREKMEAILGPFESRTHPVSMGCGLSENGGTGAGLSPCSARVRDSEDAGDGVTTPLPNISKLAL
jgi:hypothetical protein